MEIAVVLIVVAATVLAGSWLAERFRLPAPLVLIVVGIVGSYLPFVPEVSLSPELVLYGILPPLLYTAAIQTSLIDFRNNKLTILSLSVGLVLFTATGVALFLWWLIPGLPFAVAFALGAVVAPPDAVAATAVGRAIGLPRRLVTILEGESLLNDATALVSLRTALAVAGLSGAAAAEITPGEVALDFGWAVVGGVAVGVVVALVVEVVRRKLSSDPTFDTVLSFLIPFAAYVPAEKVHASGVIAVVTAGLVLGHRSPRSQPGASRLSERINWSSIQFLLENAVFLLIGLQVFYVIEEAQKSSLSWGRITAAALGTLVVVLVMRPLWVFPYRWLTTKVLHQDSHKPWTYQAVLSWAGMRGVVTLAGALLLPLETDQRDVLVLIAVVVTVGTLLLQGTTLPWLARRLGVEGPDVREDVLQAASVMQIATKAGLDRLESLDGDSGLDATTRELLRDRSADRVNQMWERLGRTGAGNETPSDQYRRGRLAMLDAERAEVLRLRDEGRAEHEVLRVVLNALDMEEMVLERIEYQASRLGEDDLLPKENVQAACDHLQEAPAFVPPHTPEGCEECLRDGTPWVHLRLCLTCGHVGCCDSSENKHASVHFDETSHPVMRSIEPGEAWRWCYVDDVIG